MKYHSYEDLKRNRKIRWHMRPTEEEYSEVREKVGTGIANNVHELGMWLERIDHDVVGPLGGLATQIVYSYELGESDPITVIVRVYADEKTSRAFTRKLEPRG